VQWWITRWTCQWNTDKDHHMSNWSIIPHTRNNRNKNTPINGSALQIRCTKSWTRFSLKRYMFGDEGGEGREGESCQRWRLGRHRWAQLGGAGLPEREKKEGSSTVRTEHWVGVGPHPHDCWQWVVTMLD
jgi:hypothetical protein